VINFNFAANQPDKAMKYLDELIAKGTKDSVAAPFVQWARRRKAQQLAALGTYQDTIAAVKLIEQNAENGKLAPTDMVNVVAVLGDRGEHESRAIAIKYLEQLQGAQGLDARQMTALARLYEFEGDWPKARDMMYAAVNSRSNDPAVFTMLATMLLNHDEAEEARRYVDRGEELAAKASEPVHETTKNDLRVARARLLALDGQKDKAAQLIEGMLVRPLPQNQLARLALVSQHMEKLGLYEGAEKLLNEYASQDERAVLALAAYKGRRGDVAEAFKLLEEARKSQPVVEIIPVALEVMRYYPKEQTSDRFKMLEEWAKGAVATEVNPYSIKLILAEMYDLEGRYDDVIKIYRELLADTKAPPALKARVQNNLAFVLAVVDPTPERAAEALALIEEAIRVLGPSSDLLDTRAVVYLAQGKAKEAAEDMRWALVDAPSISKYYHLARVEQALGNADAAREALKKANDLRGDHNPFTPTERTAFEQLQKELN
jgi:tetratricopeptide (TPR) repeat protein